MPAQGLRDVFVTKQDNALQFGVFDGDRHQVQLPRSEIPLTPTSPELTALQQKLALLATAPSAALKSEIVELVATLTGWKVDRKLNVYIDREKNRESLAQIGRLDVWHQIWRWDGREVDAKLLGLMLAEPEGDRDEAALGVPPVNGKHNSQSIVWDGPGFGLRPDYSHRSTPASLSAYRDAAAESRQEILTDDLSDDPRALYYRLAVQAFSRYEAVFGNRSVLALNGDPTAPNKDIPPNPWRRSLVKAAPAKRLSKPAIRSALPLTKDVFATGGVPLKAASVMLVLDDIAYADAGLAQRLQVGINVVRYPDNATGKSIGKHGFDVTLTSEPAPDLTSTDGSNHELSGVFGPYGLTDDYAAKMPKIRGCCYIVRVPLAQLGPASDGSNTLEGKLPWFLCEIQVRWILQENAVRLNGHGDIGELNSEPSAPMWVQFLPNVDYVLPGEWRNEAEGPHLTITQQGSDRFWTCTISGEPLSGFDPNFENQFERWLVLSERIYDIKGQPTERYLRHVRAGWCAPKTEVHQLGRTRRTGQDRRRLCSGCSGAPAGQNRWKRRSETRTGLRTPQSVARSLRLDRGSCRRHRDE